MVQGAAVSGRTPYSSPEVEAVTKRGGEAGNWMGMQSFHAYALYSNADSWLSVFNMAQDPNILKPLDTSS